MSEISYVDIENIRLPVYTEEDALLADAALEMRASKGS